MAGLNTPYKSTVILNKKKNNSLQTYNPNQLLIDANNKLGATVYSIPTKNDKVSTVTFTKPSSSSSNSNKSKTSSTNKTSSSTNKTSSSSSSSSSSRGC